MGGGTHLPPGVSAGLTFGPGGRTRSKNTGNAKMTPLGYRFKHQIIPTFLRTIFIKPILAIRRRLSRKIVVKGTISADTVAEFIRNGE
jgi:hypothetical protein